MICLISFNIYINLAHSSTNSIFSQRGIVAVNHFKEWSSLFPRGNRITEGITSFSISKISFIFLMTPIDSTNDQNTMRRVI